MKFLVYTLIGILLKQEQDNEVNSMTNQNRRDESQLKSGRRLQEVRRNQNEEPHDPEHRSGQERRTQADRRKSTS